MTFETEGNHSMEKIERSGLDCLQELLKQMRLSPDWNGIVNQSLFEKYDQDSIAALLEAATTGKFNYAFIDRPEGNSRYKCTIKYEGKHYAIREYQDLGILYCDNRADLTFPTKIAVTTDDHAVNYVMLKNNDFLISMFRFYFSKGCFRFKNLECKSALMKMLSY